MTEDDPGDDETTPSTADYVNALLEEKLSNMSELEVKLLLARTRPPKLDPKEAAAQALAAYFDQFVYRPQTDK